MMISQRLTAAFHMPFLFRLMLLLAIGLAGCAVQPDQPEGHQTDQGDQPNQKDLNTMGKDLISAAERGDTAEVTRLLAQGVPVNAQDARGRTAALAATHGGHAEVVRALIEAGADLNIRDSIKDNVLLYAGAEGELEILRLAIAAGADTHITNRFGGTALIPAAERGHVEIVRTLLTTSDVDVNHINNLGWTALLEAIVLSDGGPSHQQIVRLLIDHGADVNIPDREKVTPLQHARRRGYREIERLLVEAGAE
jgi:ankyrin repeat protein